MANNNQIYKMSNAGGFKSLVRYYDMLAGNTTWSPWAPTGAYDALATTTVGSGGVASVTFAGIPSTYKHLQIRIQGATSYGSAGNSNGYIYANSDTTSGNYYSHYLYGTGSSAGSTSNASSVLGFEASNSITYPGGIIIDLLDYANTSKYKTFRALSGIDSNGSGVVSLTSTLWKNTSAVTSITLTPQDAGWAQYTSIALYGVK